MHLCEWIGLRGAQEAFGQGHFPPNPTRKLLSKLFYISGKVREAPGPQWWIPYSPSVGLWARAGVCDMAAGLFLFAASSQGLPGVIVANKIDLRERLVVNRKQGQQMAESLGMPYFEASALDGHETDAPFATLAKTLHAMGPSE